MSVAVKLSRVERILNAALRVPPVPKLGDLRLARVRAILAEERAEALEEAAAVVEDSDDGAPLNCIGDAIRALITRGTA